MTGAEYNHINDVIEDLYEGGKLSEEDFDNLCKWIDEADKSEKYRWHDLRKNPEDLPLDEAKVICATETKAGRRNYVLGYHSIELLRWCCGMNDNVIAWRYIDPFEEVSE